MGLLVHNNERISDAPIGCCISMTDYMNLSIEEKMNNIYFINDQYEPDTQEHEVKTTTCNNCGGNLNPHNNINGLCKCEYCDGFTYVW